MSDEIKLQEKSVVLQQRLERSNARFHNLVEMSQIGMLVINVEGEVVYLNCTARNLFDGNIGRYLGEDIGIPAKEVQISEFCIMSSNGRDVVVDVHVTEIEWESELAYLASLNDITDRKCAENALRESEKRSLLLLNSTGEAIYGIDLAGKCTVCNPTGLTTLG